MIIDRCILEYQLLTTYLAKAINRKLIQTMMSNVKIDIIIALWFTVTIILN